MYESYIYLNYRANDFFRIQTRPQETQTVEITIMKFKGKQLLAVVVMGLMFFRVLLIAP